MSLGKAMEFILGKIIKKNYKGNSHFSNIQNTFTFTSPNIAGRLCVLVPKSKW